jgi:hypothetical protein
MKLLLATCRSFNEMEDKVVSDLMQFDQLRNSVFVSAANER